MLLPGFSANYVNVRTRVLVALVISFVLTPVLEGALPELPSSVAALGVLVLSEIVIGVFFGTLSRIFMGALQTAGTLISYYSSLSNAFIQDPIVEQQSSIIASFLSTLGLLLVFVTDTHHLMIRAMIDTYSLFIPGAPLRRLGPDDRTPCRRQFHPRGPIVLALVVNGYGLLYRLGFVEPFESAITGVFLWPAHSNNDANCRVWNYVIGHHDGFPLGHERIL